METLIPTYTHAFPLVVAAGAVLLAGDQYGASSRFTYPLIVELVEDIKRTGRYAEWELRSLLQQAQDELGDAALSLHAKREDFADWLYTNIGWECHRQKHSLVGPVELAHFHSLPKED